MALSDRLPALGHPDFRRWITGSFLSNIGGALQTAAVFWQLDHLVRTPQAVGYVGLVKVFPLLTFGLFAGVLADRHNRASILKITQSAMGLIAIALAILTFLGLVTPIWIYVGIGLDAVARAFDGPARQAIVANLVPSHHYANAASINGIQWRLSEVLGPVLGGLLISQLGPQNGTGAAYLVNAVSFLGLLYAVIRLPRMEVNLKGNQTVRAVFENIGDGIRFMRQTLVVRNAMWIDFWGTFVAGASALLPYLARTELHLNATQYGWLLSSQGLGAMVASSWLAWRPVFAKPGRIVIGMIGLFGLCTVGLGLSPNLITAMLCLAGVGATDMISTVMRQTIRQLAIPDAMRGRLSSIGMIFQVSGPQLGDYEASEVAALTSVRFSLCLGGFGAMFVAVWYSLRGPALRDYVYQPVTPTKSQTS